MLKTKPILIPNSEMKAFLLSILCIGLFQFSTLAQDGIFKFKKVSLSFAAINQADSLLGLDLYQNGLYSKPEKGRMGFCASGSYDSLNRVYTLTYSYAGIGGGNDNRMACPLLLASLRFMSKDKQRYVRLIPIKLDICAHTQLREIQVLNIDLNQVLSQTDQMVLVSEMEPYQVVSMSGISWGPLVKIE
jgi:hypothetical protein